MKTKVLMVCLGNICRSPLAEGILQNKVDPKYIIVDSAGTAGYHVGNPPDPRSISVASKNGIDISHQQCRKFTYSDFATYDYIYVMDKTNYSDILNLAISSTDSNKVKLLLEEGNDVPDPYYRGNDGFNQVYLLIDDACTSIAKNLK